MNESLALWITLLPTLTLGAGGVALLTTRARWAGVAELTAAGAMVLGLAAWWWGDDEPDGPTGGLFGA